jgi:catechol 2,3-dioxygenase-like lactoylglutathione lyase family enzyme
MESVQRVSAISLFVEDLAAAKAFYQQVFRAPLVYEDANSAAFQFKDLIINLLRVEAAHDIVAPGAVAGRSAGSRFQLSVWVDVVDAVCAELRARGVQLLQGPVDRRWGMRTANFVDPAGHSWEVAQKVG